MKPATACAALLLLAGPARSDGSGVGPLFVAPGDPDGTEEDTTIVAGAPASVFTTSAIEHELRYVRALDPAGCAWGASVKIPTHGVPVLPQLAVVNGRPAVGYVDSTTAQIRFARAADATGGAWSQHVVVAVAPGSASISLAVVAGRPAFAWHQVDGLHYARALDADGNAWGAPVQVESGSFVGVPCSLADVGGAPGISFKRATLLSLHYVRAADPDGTAWFTPADLGNGTEQSLGVVAGRPALAYVDSFDVVRFTRANDAVGATWAPSQVLDDEGGFDVSLAIVAGAPAVAYFKNLEVRFVRAQDAEGAAWQAPVATHQETGILVTLHGVSLAVADGDPAIAWVGQDGVSYVQAVDPEGTLWGQHVFDQGFGKPGGGGIVPLLGAAGDVTGGGTLSFRLEQAPPAAATLLLVSDGFQPTPYAGGTVCPLPLLLTQPYTTDASGAVQFDVPGGFGKTYYAQFVIADPGASFGTGISNCLEVVFGG